MAAMNSCLRIPAHTDKMMYSRLCPRLFSFIPPKIRFCVAQYQNSPYQCMYLMTHSHVRADTAGWQTVVAKRPHGSRFACGTNHLTIPT
jgi:hypothetical protein